MEDLQVLATTSMALIVEYIFWLPLNDHGCPKNFAYMSKYGFNSNFLSFIPDQGESIIAHGHLHSHISKRLWERLLTYLNDPK